MAGTAASASSADRSNLDQALQCPVVSVTSRQTRTLTAIKDEVQADLTLIVFFTHWADLGSWELAQNLLKKLNGFESAGADPCLMLHPLQAVW